MPNEIIEREYDADTPFEDNFISLKLIIDGQGIIFADKPEWVLEQLVSIIGLIVKQSQNLPRPENTIARSDKMHLWPVGEDDEIVQIATSKISETIKENLDTVKLALEVYNDYLFILKEEERIDQLIKADSKTFGREKFQAEIDMYEETISKIRNEMPFEIRMNMFLVQCKDINTQLCDKCEELITKILNRIGDFVFHELSSQISGNVKQIKDDLASKANTSELLVGFEAKLEEVKNSEKKRLMEEYNDLIAWLMLLNDNPRFKIQEDQMKPVVQAFVWVDEIVGIV